MHIYYPALFSVDAHCSVKVHLTDMDIKLKEVNSIAKELNNRYNKIQQYTLLLIFQKFLPFPNCILKKGWKAMDPVTTAIVAALTAGATAGITDTAKTAISEAYQALKDLLCKKFGGESNLVRSVEVLEAKPASVQRQQILDEEIIGVRAYQDQDIVQAVQRILQQIKAQPGGERHVQHVIGDYNAVVQGTGNATVNVNTPRQP
jgi:hypothetical protein